LEPGVNFINLFTHAFFADILAQKNFKPKTQFCNFWHQNIGKKHTHVDEIDVRMSARGSTPLDHQLESNLTCSALDKMEWTPAV